MVAVITENLELWSSAMVNKSTAGRGTSDKQTAYGIKKLRELILELAVRGKLVPQDPNDEPASVLLEKIDKEKRNLLKSGELKKQVPSTEIEDSEVPFFLPKGWEWSRIGNIGRDWGQKTPISDFTYIDVSSINNILGLITNPEIISASNAPSRARKIVKIGTVIYSTVRPYLKNICVIENEYLPEPIASTAFAILHPLQNMPGRFFAMYFRSPTFVAYVESIQNGIAYPAINDKQFFNGLVPVPPLNEQHRIVAKVDELMALCNQLEQQQTDSIAAHQTLVQTLLDTLTQAADAAEFEQAWSRIADHFDTLFTTEPSIDQLKQTLLQLAIMGKLVPQDSSDEPAIDLLKRITSERIQSTKQGKGRQELDLHSIDQDETPYELPNGWEWVRLGQIINISSGDGLTSAMMNSAGEIPVYGGNGVTGYHDKANVTTPTLVIGRVGYYCGSVHITPETAWVTDNAFVTTFSKNNIYLNFLTWLLKGTNLKENENATAQPVISGRKVYPIVVGLPPKNEQHRIVAKVDELMALCDALKARIVAAQTTQIYLADTIVEQAVA
jgi:type I restriction enzyme S subunit